MSPTHRMSKHSSSSSESHMPWSLWPKHSQLKWAAGNIMKYQEEEKSSSDPLRTFSTSAPLSLLIWWFCFKNNSFYFSIALPWKSAAVSPLSSWTSVLLTAQGCVGKMGAHLYYLQTQAVCWLVLHWIHFLSVSLRHISYKDCKEMRTCWFKRSLGEISIIFLKKKKKKI